MTFWDFLQNAGSAAWKLIGSHGTRMLGIAQGTIAVLCGVAGLIPDSHLKYWLAASAVLTFWRGQSNSNNLAGSLPAVPKT